MEISQVFSSTGFPQRLAIRNLPRRSFLRPAGVIGEAMVALVLADAFMEEFGGDSIPETRRNYEGYMKTVGPRMVYR